MIVPRPQVARAAGPGLLTTLLGSDREKFWARHYGRHPYAGAGGASALRTRLDDPLITELIEKTACDLTAVRDGRLHHGPRPASRAAADLLQADGHSLVFRHAERHAAAIAAVGGSLTNDLHGRLDAHVYVTPAGHFSFGWHFDAEEVFFLHLDGVKEFFLRENSLHRAPLLETMPADLGFEHETSPLLRCRLEPGDWLYIPHGWWHMAVACSRSFSLSLGLLPPTAIDLLEVVRRELVRDPRWRQRLPAQGNAVPNADDSALTRLQAIIAELSPDLHAALTRAGADWPSVDDAQRPGRRGAVLP